CSLDAVVGIGVPVGEIEVAPRQHGSLQDDLQRFAKPLVDESGSQVGMTTKHCLDGIAETMMVESTGQGDVDLHRVQVSLILGARAGVEQQAPLQRCQRQHISASAEDE